MINPRFKTKPTRKMGETKMKQISLHLDECENFIKETKRFLDRCEKIGIKIKNEDWCECGRMRVCGFDCA